MHLCATSFSDKEIEELLEAEGYFPGTNAYARERARRYEPADFDGRWVERNDWDPNSRGVSRVYSDQEVEQILRKDGFEPRTCDFWNERYRRFASTGLGSGEWEWSPGNRVSPRLDVA